jgi:hypothetical protein
MSRTGVEFAFNTWTVAVPCIKLSQALPNEAPSTMQRIAGHAWGLVQDVDGRAKGWSFGWLEGCLQGASR